MTKVHGKLYHPQLPPEREIVKEHLILLELMKGSDRMARAGEQWYVTCHCGGYIVTSDMNEPSKFAMKHWLGCR